MSQPDPVEPARASELARQALQDGLGHEAPRPGQVEAIAGLVSGRDVLAVLPTGAGKSSIYQAAGALIDGPTVVVSPLIALQHDQERTLREVGVGEAAVANSLAGDAVRRASLGALEDGELEFLLLSPEQLARPDTLERLRAAEPTLFVVDEAHCVTSWGHDFRPDYLRLAPVIEALGRPRVLALTATASPPVRQEIAEQLGMRDPLIVVGAFDRPEIRLEVVPCADERSKVEAVLERVEATPGAGLVYAATRRQAEEVAEELVARGIRADAYHGGMAAGRRHEVQHAFVEGEVDVVAATNAFGMGIDKADVRYVFHVDVPPSLDAYYQEVGRAGRDGEAAEAVLFWRSEDLDRQRFTAGLAEPDPQELVQVLDAVAEAGTTDAAALAEQLDATEGHLDRVLNLLAEAVAVEVLAAGRVRARQGHHVEAAARAVDIAAARRRLARSRVEMVRAYAESRTCRRRVLLSYFGDQHDEPCGRCDRCERDGLGPADADGITPSANRPPKGAASGADEGADGSDEVGDFGPESRVVHAEFGEGTVVGASDDGQLTVLFDDVGYKVLLLDLIAEHRLLAPAPAPTV